MMCKKKYLAIGFVALINIISLIFLSLIFIQGMVIPKTYLELWDLQHNSTFEDPRLQDIPHGPLAPNFTKTVHEKATGWV